MRVEFLRIFFPAIILSSPLLSASQRLTSDLRSSSARGFVILYIAEKERFKLMARIRSTIQGGGSRDENRAKKGEDQLKRSRRRCR